MENEWEGYKQVSDDVMFKNLIKFDKNQLAEIADTITQLPSDKEIHQ